ncbi:Uncharacterised protein [Mycobacteroides abscessus subsp. abscessus]|nr:Uncharacterised protein [Mycobacteroides abscessus subsp. abscessus]
MTRYGALGKNASHTSPVGISQIFCRTAEKARAAKTGSQARNRFQIRKRVG